MDKAVLENIGYMIGALVGVLTIIPTLHNWSVNRTRAKLQSDIKILESLLSAQNSAKDNVPFNEYASGKLTDAINDLSCKIEFRTSQVRERLSPERTDIDWSDVWTGLSLLFTARLLSKYVHLEALQNAVALRDWMFEMDIVIVFLACIGAFVLVKGFRRTNNLLRWIFGLPPLPPGKA